MFTPNAYGLFSMPKLETDRLILRSEENLTLMLGLSQLQGNFGLDYRVVLAGAVAAFIPVAVLFFICQKYFFRGMESGGVKL